MPNEIATGAKQPKSDAGYRPREGRGAPASATQFLMQRELERVNWTEAGLRSFRFSRHGDYALKRGELANLFRAAQRCFFCIKFHLQQCDNMMGQIIW